MRESLLIPRSIKRAGRITCVCIVGLLAATIAGCTAPTQAADRQKVDDALASFELSSTNVRLSPKVYAAFRALDEAMLVPSHIFGDTSKWTGSSPDTRTLTIGATFRDGR